jgi:hypothetical protein
MLPGMLSDSTFEGVMLTEDCPGLARACSVIVVEWLCMGTPARLAVGVRKLLESALLPLGLVCRKTVSSGLGS